MKKQLFITAIFFLAFTAFSQSSKKARPSGTFNTKALLHIKSTEGNGVPGEQVTPIKPTPLPVHANSKTSSINWQGISSSMNIFGMLVSYCKPLQWNDELDAVTFVHRKSPTYQISPAPAPDAETGGIVAFVSMDCGASWDSTALFANDNFWARYPSGAIYNPTGNTDISNTYIVGAGPTTGAGNVTWIGNWYASKRLGTTNYNNIPSTLTNAQQVMPTAPPFSPGVPSRHDFTAYNFTSTDDGKVRVLAGITDDVATSDTAVMLMTGTFNSTSMTFDWTGRVFDPPTTVESDGTENWVSRPMMAWNEQGTVGYVVIIGSRLGATGSNVGNQPIVYKTTNSGSTWSLESSIDFNASNNSVVKKRLWPVNTDTALVVPNFLWIEGMDCSVDYKNRLHIFTSLVGHSSNHLDSTNFVSRWTADNYLWPHTPGQMPYLADFVYDGANTNTWSKILIDSMSTEGPWDRTTDPGYQDNPWDPDPSQLNQKVRIDARLQMSRTPDGKHLLYSWAESDTSYTDFQRKWNTLPNLKARLYDVEQHNLSSTEIDLTVDAQGEVANHAMYHFISPKFKLVSKTQTEIEVQLPVTVSNSNPYSQKTVNQHWYSCAGISFSRNGIVVNPWDDNSTIGLPENGGILNISQMYPNPAQDRVHISLYSTTGTKIEIAIMNLVGEIVKTSISDVINGINKIEFDIADLPAGIYVVTLKSGSKTTAKKLIKE